MSCTLLWKWLCGVWAAFLPCTITTALKFVCCGCYDVLTHRQLVSGFDYTLVVLATNANTHQSENCEFLQLMKVHWIKSVILEWVYLQTQFPHISMFQSSPQKFCMLRQVAPLCQIIAQPTKLTSFKLDFSLARLTQYRFAEIFITPRILLYIYVGIEVVHCAL